MRTATVRELRNQYRSVLDQVEAGEEIAISRRGKIIARLVPEKVKPKKVDWSKSAAFTLDKSKMPFLVFDEVQAALNESKGRY
jgi:prevent-host-death family protein